MQFETQDIVFNVELNSTDSIINSKLNHVGNTYPWDKEKISTELE